MKPETARIHGGQEDKIVKRFHIAEDMIEFIPAEDAWQSIIRLGFHDFEEVPILSRDVDGEAFHEHISGS